MWWIYYWEDGIMKRIGSRWGVLKAYRAAGIQGTWEAIRHPSGALIPSNLPAATLMAIAAVDAEWSGT